VCGIAGIVGITPADRAWRMRAMREAIVHRGPDSAGEHCDAHVALGVRRLSVIDLITGDQPQCGEGDRVWTVFNGEIYNFQELREELASQGHRFRTRSDTEVIVHLYERDGDRAIEKLDGMFALAIWDSASRTLLLARDRLGKKPLLFFEGEGELLFASEHRALLAGLQPRQLGVDAEAIALYLRLGYVPAPFDAFRGARKLQPGELLVWQDARTRRRSYWSPPSGIASIDEREAVVEVRRLFDSAVAKRLVADVPIGAFLSGGVDSSALVASMAAQAPVVRTFTIGFEELDYSEVRHARRVAERYGTEHHEFVVRPDMLAILPLLVRHYGEPFADSSAVPTYYLSKLTRDSVTVALAGDGGDELFAGYQRHHAVHIAGAIDRAPGGLRRPLLAVAERLLTRRGSERASAVRLRRFVRGARQPREHRYLSWLAISDEAWLQESATDTFAGAARMAGDELRRRAGAFDGDAVRQARGLDLGMYLPDDLLVKVDIASMANSLEVRSPFLDRALVEFALRLPTSLLIRGTRRKWILRRAFADTLPKENLARRKQGFGLPVGRWLRSELRPMLDDVVLSDRALRRGFLRPEAVRRLAQEHLAGVDHTHRLWSLLMLELWHREFIDA
jgi:asparagine synthase (glutamine-hydrolysing)